jgi:uncharacterized protein
MRRWLFSLVGAISIIIAFGRGVRAQLFPSQAPMDPNFDIKAIDERFDFDRREAMIPMRDGVKLYSVILIPRIKKPMPMLLTRTPYGAIKRSPPEQGLGLKSALTGGDDIFADAGYIRVFQDIRGKHRSEGDYVMTRPLRGPLNSTEVDHSTDTRDTIEWLVKNIHESNGNVGMIGTSYDGFLVLMGLVNPHPALKAAVAINPMVDGWIGDDWFHKGAFRQMMMEYIRNQESSSPSQSSAEDKNIDEYELYFAAGSAGELGRRNGMDSLEFWRSLLRHPAYDAFWQSQAVDKILAAQSLKIPTLFVHSLWDQEDIYGALAAYRAIEAQDINNDKNYLAIGPWPHGGSNGDEDFSALFQFKDSPSRYFRRSILLPFLNERLKEGAPKANTPPVLAFETGTNTWRRYNAWPLSCETGCSRTMQPLYLLPGMRLEFNALGPAAESYAEYISDPAQPVLYSARPIRPVYGPGSTWERWMVEDQRKVSSRPDVLSYVSDKLTQPIALSGQPIANLFASTSGADCDFIVKLIDVYPDKYPLQPDHAGYQLIISADILRGRYRNDMEHPSPIPAGKIERYRWALPATNHVFLPGHRIMVQIQSSWFPLYDRNPQTFVENIFWAKPEDYRQAAQRIYQSGKTSSSIELPIQ